MANVILQALRYLTHYPFELFIALFLFGINQERRDHFLFRLIPCVIVYAAVVFVTWWSGIPVSFKLGNWLDMVTFITFALSMAAFYVCFRVRVKTVIFYGMGAYAMQHLLNNVVRLIIDAYGGSFHKDFLGIFIEFIVYAVFYTLFYFVFIRKVKESDLTDPSSGSIFAVSVLTVCIVIFLSLFLTWIGRKDRGGEYTALYTLLCRLYAIVCCIIDLYVQFGLMERGRMQWQNAIMEEVLRQEASKNKLKKESVEIINMKFHDLKHQLNLMKKGAGGKAQDEYIAELEKTIRDYECIIETGYEPLDVILSEKKALCDKFKINFTCMIDGRLLAFMSDSDVYSLFGNAMDNAIDCLIKEKEECRNLRLASESGPGNVLIRMENTCSADTKFVKGLPVTDKKEKEYHGFGVKSMAYIVKKYNGEMHMRKEDNVFIADFLFGN